MMACLQSPQSGAQTLMSATRTVAREPLVSITYLSDEPVPVHEDPADRRRSTASKHTAIHRGVAEQIIMRHRNEDVRRERSNWFAKGADDIIRNASPGRNAVSAEAFAAVLELAFPLADYPRERRQANRAGRIEWGGGVVFERVTE